MKIQFLIEADEAQAEALSRLTKRIGIDFRPYTHMTVLRYPDQPGEVSMGGQLHHVLKAIEDEFDYDREKAKLPDEAEEMTMAMTHELLEFGHRLFDWKGNQAQSTFLRTEWDMTCREAIADQCPVVNKFMQEQEKETANTP